MIETEPKLSHSQLHSEVHIPTPGCREAIDGLNSPHVEMLWSVQGEASAEVDRNESPLA